MCKSEVKASGADIETVMTREQTVIHKPMAAESGKFAWTEKRRRRRSSPQQKSKKLQIQNKPNLQVISGMLPTLQALSGISCDSDIQKFGVCLIPLEASDAASHLQITLLEAYCREIGLKLLKLPEQALRDAFGDKHQDLGCLLLLGIENDELLYFLESPE